MSFAIKSSHQYASSNVVIQTDTLDNTAGVEETKNGDTKNESPPITNNTGVSSNFGQRIAETATAQEDFY